MTDELSGTLQNSSKFMKDEKTEEKKGIRFKTDSTCINTKSFFIQLNKDDEKKDHIHLLEQMQQLRYDETLSKNEKTEKFDEIIRKYKKNG